MRTFILGVAAFAVAGFTAAVSAATRGPTNEQLMQVCKERSGERSQGACTALINALDRRSVLAIRAHFYRGFYYLDTNKALDAKSDFEAVVRERPNDAGVRINLARAYWKLGLKSSAINEVTRALEIDPTNKTALSDRAHCFAATRQYQKAIADFDSLLKIAPNSAAAYGDRGETETLANDYPDAMRDLNKAITLDPHNVEYVKGRAVAETLAHDYAAGLRDLDAAIRMRPSSELYYTRCYARALQGRNLDLAFADCAKASRDKRYAAEATALKSLLLLRSKRYEEAVHAADDTLQAMPNSEVAFFAKGVAERETGHTALGNSDIAKAKKLNSQTIDELVGAGIGKADAM